jgi:ribosomal protein L22
VSSIEQLAEAYAARIRQANHKEREIREIASLINGLTYSDGGRPLSLTDKSKLVLLVAEGLASKRTRPGGGFITEGENRNTLALVGLLRRATGVDK